MKTVGQKRIEYVWIVIAVQADGSSPGNCGHDHADQGDAEACPWTPEPWPERCDLLVRKARDRRIDPPRTKTRRAA